MSALHGSAPCIVCQRKLPACKMRPWISVRPGVSELIAVDHPDWGPGHAICRDDLADYRGIYVERLLERERGELSDLEKQVVESLQTGQLLSQNLLDDDGSGASFGERAADRVAAFGGSWTFILLFMAILMVWMTVNVVGLLAKPFDPYPFILLNLVLSSLAALQAPVIMMSQRRQETKDRARAGNDYRVNRKAELEIRQGHEKMDHQLAQQWDKLAEVQQIQIGILHERANDHR